MSRNATRDSRLNGGQSFNTEELFGLMECGIMNADAIAARLHGEMRSCGDFAATQNLAVLEWRHRNFRMGMTPRRIKSCLEEARRLNVPTAEANLKVLLDHIPESDMGETLGYYRDGRLTRDEELVLPSGLFPRNGGYRS